MANIFLNYIPQVLLKNRLDVNFTNNLKVIDWDLLIVENKAYFKEHSETFEEYYNFFCDKLKFSSKLLTMFNIDLDKGDIINLWILMN